MMSRIVTGSRLAATAIVLSAAGLLFSARAAHGGPALWGGATGTPVVDSPGVTGVYLPAGAAASTPKTPRAGDGGLAPGGPGNLSGESPGLLCRVLRHRKGRDTDKDGIPNDADACPETPEGMPVDDRGCPRDADGDGVPDGRDACPQTPSGAMTDPRGCARDTDRDGVPDGIDLCPGTDEKALVNADGCPFDTDGDGVLDGIDRCPDTPMGSILDETGCPVDSDGDGVPDGIDLCPGTATGSSTDERGCPVHGKGKPSFPTIRFPAGRVRIDARAAAALEKVAELIRSDPRLVVEIGGHTDTSGPASVNRRVSLRRAEAVKRYLVSKGVPPSQLVTKGYGEVHPVASNRTPEGRAANRRIEFKVLSPP